MKDLKSTKKIKSYSGDEHYSNIYNDEFYNSLRLRDAHKLISELSSMRLFKKKSAVLDIGCGTGELGHLIIEKYGSMVHGLDLNKAAVARSIKNGVRAKMGDVEKKWPFSKDSIDAVVCVQMIEHLVNPDFFLLESKRVLKKNGYVIITTPNLAAWFNRILLLLGFQPFFTEVSTVDKTLGLSFTRKLTVNRKPMGHLRCFTLKALVEILELHNFEIVHIQGSAVNYLPKYVSFFDKFLSQFASLASDLVVVAKKK